MIEVYKQHTIVVHEHKGATVSSPSEDRERNYGTLQTQAGENVAMQSRCEILGPVRVENGFVDGVTFFASTPKLALVWAKHLIDKGDEDEMRAVR